MGRERCEEERGTTEAQIMACAEREHAAAYGEEHPLSRGRASRGRWRAMAHGLVRQHGHLGWWRAALAAFYADGYWRPAGHPFDAFVRQAARYMRDARRAEDGQDARRRADDEFERDLREFERGGDLW